MAVKIHHITEFNPVLIQEILEKMNESDFQPNPVFFEDEKNVLLMAYLDDQLAGYLWAHLLHKPDETDPEMFLYSVDVLEAHRRKGVGSALIDKIKKMAKSKGCKEMWVLTNKSNQKAMGLYEKNGGKIDEGDELMYTFYL